MPALVLEIKTIKKANSIKFTIQIVSQHHRGGRASFQATNGFYFSSLSCPAISCNYNDGKSHMQPMMYLRGSGYRRDNDIMTTKSIGYIERLKAAVIEYNIAKEDIT